MSRTYLCPTGRCPSLQKHCSGPVAPSGLVRASPGQGKQEKTSPGVEDGLYVP